jgi:transposase
MAKDRNPKELAYMEKRKAQGLTHKEVGEQFGMSKSHAHRLIKSKREADEDCKK